jgi:G3E family GTPase
MADERGVSAVPVTVLTGFLGSGKTTILNGLLKRQGMQGTAIIINEFGEVGLDHDLIEYSSEDLVFVANGCVCCTIRGDLIATFESLSTRQRRAEIPSCDRVIIETTGLADPAPILHTLMNHPSVTACYRLDSVVATVDAVNATSTLDQHEEAVKQIAVADRMLMTKVDMASAVDVSALRARLAVIKPGACIAEAINGDVEPSDLFNAGSYDPQTKTLDVQRWLRAEAYDEERVTARDHGDHRHEAAHVDRNRHNDRVRAYCVIREQPVSWAGFSAWLEMLSAMRGADLLRVKGIISIIERPSQPVVIHGVQHIFHPPTFLDEWPTSDHRTRIVFITRDIEKDAIEETLRVFERGRQRGE